MAARRVTHYAASHPARRDASRGGVVGICAAVPEREGARGVARSRCELGSMVVPLLKGAQFPSAKLLEELAGSAEILRARRGVRSCQRIFMDRDE
jgi:hypothetical protein